MMDLNIWTASGLSLFVGILIGVVLDDAFDMLREAARTRGRRVRLRMPSQSTLMSFGLAVVLFVNGFIGVALIQQRATSDAFAQCLVSAQKAQDALDAIVFAVAADDNKAIRDALDSYVALRSRPASELCGVRR